MLETRSTESESLQRWRRHLQSLQLVARADNALVALDHLIPLGVGGDDAENFLQAQLSNDVARAKNDEAQLTAYCNPKGRALGIFYLLRRASDFVLLVPADIAEPLATRLRMYVLRAKVNIAPLDCAVVGGIGEAPLDNAHALPGESRRAALLPFDAALALFDANKQTLCASAAWRLCDIARGIACVYAPNYEALIPQMVNLDLTGGVSFDKGCYPGQEIIARLHYLGRPKQRMLRAEVAGEAAAGMPIFSAQRPQTKSGVVVDAVRAAGDKSELLATAPFDAMDAGDLMLGAPDGPLLARLPLPYPIPAAEK